MGSEETEPSPEPVKTDVTLPPPTPPTPTQAEQWLADARKALADRRHRDARYIADRIVSRYPGTPAAMAARELLDTLPHPDGRLVCGFDNPDDLKAWRRHRPYRSSMRFAAVSDPARIRDGAGAAHLLLPRDPDYTTGAVVFELGRFDEESFRGLSFWIHQERPSPGRLEIAFIRPDQKRLPFIDRWGGSEMGACIYRAIPLDFVGWKQIRIPLSAFRTRGATGSRGKIGWRDVGALVLYDASRKGVDVVIDGLRFLEADRG